MREEHFRSVLSITRGQRRSKSHLSNPSFRTYTILSRTYLNMRRLVWTYHPEVAGSSVPKQGAVCHASTTTSGVAASANEEMCIGENRMWPLHVLIHLSMHVANRQTRFCSTIGASFYCLFVCLLREICARITQADRKAGNPAYLP